MSPVPQMTPTIKFNRGRNDSISNWNWPLLLSRVNDICYDLTEATNTRSKDGLALGMDRMNLCVQSMFAIVDPILDTLDESAVSSIEIRQRKKRVVAEWSTLMGVSKELMINPTVSDLQMLMVSTIDEISEVIREFIEEIRDSNFINDPSRKGSRDKSAASLFALTSPPANAHPLDFYISLVHDMNKYTQMGKLLQAEKMYQSFLKESDNLNGYLERMNWFNVTPNRRDALKAMRTEVQDMVKAFLFETRISQGMYNVPSVLEAVTGLELTLRNFKSELVSSEQFSKTTSPVSPVSNEATTRRLHISPIMTQDPKWGSESKIKKLLGENPLVSPVSHASPRIVSAISRLNLTNVLAKMTYSLDFSGVITVTRSSLTRMVK